MLQMTSLYWILFFFDRSVLSSSNQTTPWIYIDIVAWSDHFGEVGVTTCQLFLCVAYYISSWSIKRAWVVCERTLYVEFRVHGSFSYFIIGEMVNYIPSAKRNMLIIISVMLLDHSYVCYPYISCWSYVKARTNTRRFVNSKGYEWA